MKAKFFFWFCAGVVLFFDVFVFSVNFLNRKFSSKEWLKIQEKVDCMAKNGEWKYDLLRVSYRYDSNMSFHQNARRMSACSGPVDCAGERQYFDVNQHPNFYYSWETTPGKCGSSKLGIFNHSEFCRVFPAGNILFAGDSLMDAFSVSFNNLVFNASFPGSLCLKAPLVRYSHHNFFHCPATTSSPARTVKTYFARSDYVQPFLVDKNVSHPGHDSWAKFLSPSSKHYDPEIRLVILNRGAHWVANNTEVMEDLRETFSFLRQFPHVSVIWRYPVYGHSDYKENFYTLPLKSFNESAELPHEGTYGPLYYRCYLQSLVLNEFIAKEFPEVLQLDVLSLTKLRKDLRQDPLHLCIPGIYEIWADLLLAALKLISDF
jgi:hypothetical protein